MLIILFVIHIDTIDEMISQLEVHLVGKRLKHHILNIGRKITEYQVTLGLERTPDCLKGTWIESGKSHEILWFQRLFRVIEIPLGILVFWLFHPFAEHLACLQARNRVFL